MGRKINLNNHTRQKNNNGKKYNNKRENNNNEEKYNDSNKYNNATNTKMNSAKTCLFTQPSHPLKFKH